MGSTTVWPAVNVVVDRCELRVPQPEEPVMPKVTLALPRRPLGRRARL